MGSVEYWTVRVRPFFLAPVTIRRTPGGMFEWSFMGEKNYHHGLADTLHGAKQAARQAAESEQ